MSKRILLTSLLVTLFVLIFFTVASIEIYHGQTVDEAENTLTAFMNVYESTDKDIRELSDTLDGARITLLDSNGAILDDTGGGEKGEVLTDDEVLDAMKNGTGIAERYSADSAETEVFMCKATEDGYVRISVLIPSPSTMFVRALPMLTVFIIIDIILCLLFTWLATSFILRPVKELAQASIGNDKKVSVRYKELQPVADVINQKNDYVRESQNSKDEFISNITHEMNTPLTSIRGFAELISSGNMDKAKTVKAGKTILRQSERLSAMITQILHYSAIDDDRLTPYEVNVSTLVREQLNSYVPLLKDKSLTLEEHIEDGVTVSSRRERIVEILDNLVSNAIKYNKQNGKIIVTLDARKLAVEDTGIGIAHDELPHIFSRFYTVDKSHGENVGFGLGLSIVRKICERSEWTLDVDSTPGEGTKFTIGFRK